MSETASNRLSQLATDAANVIPSVDAATEGQYGAGLGSEPEERQIELILAALQESKSGYNNTEREVTYPEQNAVCDLVIDDTIPVEAKLLRYWRGNGDPEPNWHKQVFSPFNSNTLLTDAKRLHESEFETPAGLLGLFYARSSDDPTIVEELPDKFTASELAQKVVQDIDYWYEFDVEISNIVSFAGLQHDVHQRGSVICWVVE